MGGWIGGIVPFTRAPLLFCYTVDGERAKGARRRSLCNPGSRRSKSPLRGARDLLRLAFGSGAGNIPVSCALRPHPCGRPRPAANVPAIFSRTQGQHPQFPLTPVVSPPEIAGLRRNETGSRVEPAAGRWLKDRAVRSTDFFCGVAGIDKGRAKAPLIPFTFCMSCGTC